MFSVHTTPEEFECIRQRSSWISVADTDFYMIVKHLVWLKSKESGVRNAGNQARKFSKHSSFRRLWASSAAEGCNIRGNGKFRYDQSSGQEEERPLSIEPKSGERTKENKKVVKEK